MSYDVLQSVERWLAVILTAQSNGIDPVTDAAWDDLVVAYAKEGDATVTVKVMALGDWRNLGNDMGMYEVKFSTSELNTLGSFFYSVQLADVNFCTDFVPYYGHVEVVADTVNTIGSQLDTIESKVDTVDGVVDGIQTDVTSIEGKVDTVDTVVDGIQTDVTSIESKVDTVDGVVDNIYIDTQQIIINVAAVDSVVDGIQTDVTSIESKVDTVDSVVDGIQTDVTAIDGKINTIDGVVDNVYIDTQAILVDTNQLSVDIAALDFNQAEVGAGFYYSSGTLTASLVLHRNGAVVGSPVSATITMYDEDGLQLLTSNSSSPDAQGVFKFSESIVLVDGTVPYVESQITDVSGTVRSVVLAPVIP